MYLVITELYRGVNGDDEIVDTLKVVIAQMRAKSGCLAARIYFDVEDPISVTCFQEWSTRSAFEAYARSSDFFNMMEAIDLSSKPPSVRLIETGDAQGIELIRSMLMVGQ